MFCIRILCKILIFYFLSRILFLITSSVFWICLTDNIHAVSDGGILTTAHKQGHMLCLSSARHDEKCIAGHFKYSDFLHGSNVAKAIVKKGKKK